VSQASQVRTYDPAASVVFLKTNERFGGLSNMAPGFPLRVNNVRIRTSEALYQACRFPHMPDVQRKIIDEHSPMTAKMRSKPFRDESRADWEAARVKIMRWCLRVKLAQNWREFGRLLLATGDRPIVEQSRKDDFWGAKVAQDGSLVGMNVLGRLLMELREQLKSDEAESLWFIEPLPIPEFLLFGQRIEPVQAGPKTEIPAWINEPPPQTISVPKLPVEPQPSLVEPPVIADATPPAAVPPADAVKGWKRLESFSRYRHSNLLWLGEIPEHWDIRRNGRLFAARRETGFPDLPVLEVSIRSGVRVRDFDPGGRKQEMSDRSKYQRAARGDIAYNMMRMWQGAVGIAPIDGLVSPAYVVARPFAETDAAYYAYLFRTAAYTREIDTFSRGIVPDRNRLYWESFKQMPSVYPPLDEQRLIVRFLDWHGAQTAKLIRAKQGLLKLVAEEREALTQAVVSSSETQQRRLKNIVDHIFRNVERESVRSYTPVGMFNKGRGIFRKIPAKGDELGDSTFSWIEDGDLILSGQFAWEGAVAIAGADEAGCVASHRYHIIRGKEDLIQTIYLSSFLRTSLGNLLLNEHSRGAAGRNRPLNIRTLLKEEIPIPPQKEQARLIELVTLEKQLVGTLTMFADRLREFRTRLIADVVTGKLDVRGAAASLPDVTEIEPIDDLTEGDDLDEAVDDVETEDVVA